MRNRQINKIIQKSNISVWEFIEYAMVTRRISQFRNRCHLKRFWTENFLQFFSNRLIFKIVSIWFEKIEITAVLCLIKIIGPEEEVYDLRQVCSRYN